MHAHIIDTSILCNILDLSFMRQDRTTVMQEFNSLI